MNHARVISLAIDLSRAKLEEDAANERRIAAEVALINELGFVKPEGQESYEATDGTRRCRIVCKQPIGTKVDDNVMAGILKALDKKDPARNVVTVSFGLDTKAARALEEKDPASWLKIAPAISRKPGKVQVSVDELVAV